MADRLGWGGVGVEERKSNLEAQALATEEWRVQLGRGHRRQLWTPGTYPFAESRLRAGEKEGLHG